MGEGLIPFALVSPTAGEQVRVATTRGHADLPDGEYGFFEWYCPEVGCHCRRVMLNVIAKQETRTLASISYGFDREGEFAGPFLDPMNPQSPLAPALLILARQILADANYVARLEAHYYQVKGACADPSHPVHRKLRELDQPAPKRRTAPQTPARRQRKRR